MLKQTEQPKLTARFEEALVYAHQLHARQTRKSTGIPYIAHLLSVTALVLEDGGDEDEAIAALLHDAVEDQGGDATRREIRRRFGARVAAIVDGCTDADTIPKPPWRWRKEQFIASLHDAAPGVLRVASADKLHNARSLLSDFREQGDAVWARFKGGKEGTMWYYRELVKILTAKNGGQLVAELARVVAELDKLISS